MLIKEIVLCFILRLTHWGRVTHICVSELTIIGSDNGLSPGRRQAIIWTNAGILLFRPLGTNFSEILIEIHIFSFKKMHSKCSSAKWRPFCLGINVLRSSLAFFMRPFFSRALIFCTIGQLMCIQKAFEPGWWWLSALMGPGHLQRLW